MFSQFPAPKLDPILSLLADYLKDARADKIDLGVGVYKNELGETPIMAAVKAAEKQMVETQQSKSYLGLLGNVDYSAHISNLVLGDVVDDARVSAIQSPGGSGALRMVFEMIERATPDVTLWVSSPTWANHNDMIDAVGLTRSSYRYFDAETRLVNFEQMLESLDAVRAGDVIVLHGCCHNPCGADLSTEQWQTLANWCAERGALVLIDFAYQGFGGGLQADAQGVRLMAQALPEMFVTVSCSKNFGLYRDRIGCAIALSAPENRVNTLGAMQTLARVNYSMPPDHGASIVYTIMQSTELRAMWASELESMRLRMRDQRAKLVTALQNRSKDERFEFLNDHRGMFSLVGASPEQVDQLRNEHAIYIIGNSRINVAGLQDGEIDRIAKAFLDVGL